MYVWCVVGCMEREIRQTHWLRNKNGLKLEEEMNQMVTSRSPVKVGQSSLVTGC